jgi:Cu-Zn family superoxide dismutase
MTMHERAFATPRGRRVVAAIATAGVLSTAVAATSVDPRAAAVVPAEATATQVATRVYTLPGDEVLPDGIAVDGDTYYATGEGGTIYRGDLDEPEAEVLISDLGFPTLDIDVVGGRLLVARGFAGVSLYDRTTGDVVATWSVAAGSFALRIALAPNGDAYITDADAPVLYRITAAELGRPPAAEQELRVFLEWPDPPVHYERGFTNANGIVASLDGKFVLVVHQTTGELFRVRLSDKQVRRVDLGRYRLIGGRGMVLTDDRILYVVRFGRPAVAKLRLDARYQRARLLSETTDPTFSYPRGAAIAGDRLLVANNGSVGDPPRWAVSSIRLP